MTPRPQCPPSGPRPPLRPFRRVALAVGLGLAACTGVARAQMIPWLEFSGPAVLPPDPPVARKPESTERDPAARPAPRRDPRRERRVRVAAAPADDASASGDPGVFARFASVLGASPVTLSDFGGGAADGAARSGTTWAGQVIQNAGTLTVAGTARDDNGWGAARVTLDASGMAYLNITAQRDAGHATPTVFIQFEDFSLRTKVISVSAAQFAVGALTVVQVPLTGWSIDFGPSQIVSWSLGGGGVGEVDFRMTFDSISFSATAIPEPATSAVAGALVALAAGFWRRSVRRSRRS